VTREAEGQERPGGSGSSSRSSDWSWFCISCWTPLQAPTASDRDRLSWKALHDRLSLGLARARCVPGREVNQ